MHSPEFWFFTLSSIPQTLGAMIVMAATFAIFKLSFVKQSMAEDIKIAKWFLLKADPDIFVENLIRMPKEGIADHFRKAVNNLRTDAPWLGLGQQQWRVVQDEFPEIIDTVHRPFAASPERIITFLTHKASDLEKEITTGKRIFGYLRYSIFFTVVPVVFSLIALPLYSFVANPFLVIGISVLLALWGVLYMTYSVLKVAYF